LGVTLVMQNQESELINRPAAAKMLGVQEGQIRRYEKRGELAVADTQMLGQQRRPLYRKSDVEAIKAKRERLGSTEVV
jgi:DNA-binding transcriptional MerR regulator